MKKKIILCAIIIFIINLFYGCSVTKDVQNVITEEKNEFIYAIDKIPNTLNVDTSLSNRENDIICSLFEGLVELNEKGNPIPSLSDGWKVDKDNIEYIFDLKADIKWSNGEPIIANDFVNFFEHLLSPLNKDYNSEELYTIYGVKEYREGKIDFTKVAIKALDEDTLIIRLNKKDDKILHKLAKPSYRLRDMKDKLSNYKNQFYSIKYSGPYIITDVSEKNDIWLEKNKYFYENNDYLGKVVIREKQEEEVEFAAYNIGKIDILSNPPVTSLEEGELYKKIYTYPTTKTQLLLFNTKSNVGGFIDFRKGITNALMLEILDSYLLKNKTASWLVSELKYSDIINKNVNRVIPQIIDNKEKREVFEKHSSMLFNNININKSVIDIIALDTKENRIIGEFIGGLLKQKFSLSSKITFYSEEDLEKKLSQKKFDIFLNEIDFNNNDDKTINFIKENKDIFDKEYAIISLFNKNDIWCKLDSVKYLHIDGYGNLLFKYIEKV